jgi:hypothetical protein
MFGFGMLMTGLGISTAWMEVDAPAISRQASGAMARRDKLRMATSLDYHLKKYHNSGQLDDS